MKLTRIPRIPQQLLHPRHRRLRVKRHRLPPIRDQQERYTRSWCGRRDGYRGLRWWWWW
ncbi:hypothetical protein BDV98DRAFT_572703 [Pterulicium gracile]|uniref:Uncharacterized protein n=1 Tax=Pterulicium gracile TaxID=1884261 RepID=A0A5C3QDE2_9AGAR|nr:hypothetical protein BDV98DRAFT_572703 [Pterula gracilis]